MRFALVLLLCLLWLSPALAEKRVALLIGNQSYTSEIGHLANPHNDIALLEQALKGLKFEVTSVRDAGLAALQRAVNAYVRRVRAAGPSAVGFFYYSGHGAADAGTNYLIPVDVTSVEEAELWDQSLRLMEVTRKLKGEAGNATHFVVFDACRNNLRLRKAGSRALVQSRGFVPVVQESGMLIAYATAEGELALDVGVGSGPYAKVLAEEIIKPGVEAVTMFRNVQRRVRAAINQEPYLGFNAMGDVYLAGLAPDPPKAPAAPAPAVSEQLSEAERAWVVAKDATSIPALEAFIRRFGDTYYGDLAKVRLAELKQAEAAKKKGGDDARAKAEAERLALLQQEERRRAEAEAVRKRPQAAEAKKIGQAFRDCSDCPEMVVLPAGDFVMGSPPNEKGRADNEGPQRKVTIARPFAVGKYETTFAEWDACVASGGCKHTPWHGGWGRGRRPVINVSWNDITNEYLPWLSRKTGTTYRLPTEAEWEYAARAGTTTRFHFGNDEKDLCTYDNSADQTLREKQGAAVGGSHCRDGYTNTAPVGSFGPNAFGLFDMHGNTSEWVQDCYRDSYAAAPADGSAVTSGGCGTRVVRGGTWGDFPRALRSALRSGHPPHDRGSESFGFRLARTLD